MSDIPSFDCVVVGGGPAGATAAHDLARLGRQVALLDREGRVKPCGGAIPPRLMRDFQIPDSMLVARARAARIVAPSRRTIDMPIDGGFVGMVDRDVFDEWLRVRAAKAGATRIGGTFLRIERDDDVGPIVVFRPKDAPAGCESRVRARSIVGADGANSAVSREAVPSAGRPKFVFAYHEVIRTPLRDEPMQYDATRCDIYYTGELSPDFYAWIFPHGETASVGVGSARKGFSLRAAVGTLREVTNLVGCETIRREGAPIPLKPLKRWDNGRDVVLTGDAAGIVAPASGEGIYYAMVSGRLAGASVDQFLATGDARVLASVRMSFMKAHGLTFFVLRMMQHFWYANDRRRERFVTMCADPDVQQLTWQAYMNKELVRAKPAAHVRIFFKDLGHLLGLAKPF